MRGCLGIFGWGNPKDGEPMCERVRVLCLPYALSLGSMSVPSVMCGEFARAWPIDWLLVYPLSDVM